MAVAAGIELLVERNISAMYHVILNGKPFVEILKRSKSEINMPTKIKFAAETIRTININRHSAFDGLFVVDVCIDGQNHLKMAKRRTVYQARHSIYSGVGS